MGTRAFSSSPQFWTTTSPKTSCRKRRQVLTLPKLLHQAQKVCASDQ